MADSSETFIGETPERMEFNHPLMKSMLSPYFEVTQAVRNGDVQAFRAIQQKYNDVFLEDRTVNVIERLNTNVIKAAIKRIAQGYSRIYLKDIASKIGLQDVEDVEFIVAKAIRDGSIEGYINHDKGYFCTKESQNIYNTSTPQQQFHLRVTFCMDIHNEAVKAMRFEPNAHKKNLEDADQRKERLQQEQELADSIVDDPEGF